MRDDADLTLDAGAPPGRESGVQVRHLDLEALSLHIDDELEQGQRMEAEVHLASCSLCALDFEEMHLTVTLLRALPQYDPPRTFVLSQEYGRIKHRPMPQPVEQMQAPVPAYLPAAMLAGSAPAPEKAVWHSRLLPSAGALKVASTLAGVGLLVALAGDMVIPDPPPAPLGIVAQASTSIFPPPSARAISPDAALPAPPAQAGEIAGTESQPAAFGEVNAAPATAAAIPSPWRVAQIGLGMLLLWLLVSLASRMWMDHHERMPD